MKLRDDFEVVGDVRGKGLMTGMELVKDKVRDINDLLLHHSSGPLSRQAGPHFLQRRYLRYGTTSKTMES